MLLNWSYTIAVFTDPGSPLATNSGYSHLPTHEPLHNPDLPSFTVKSTGEARFCKKCQARKPDRAHHCSTCKRCVLKMDHHCPWLATCVGLRNYKPFLLFLSYTTLFCWMCFGVTGTWLWSDFANEGQYNDSFMPINYVLLCVIAGIIGLVLTGFTAWHISLAWRGQTTIECLEKTRYLSPLRRSLRKQQFGADEENAAPGQIYGRRFAEIPGITQAEEGEGNSSNGGLGQIGVAGQALRRNYNNMERSRERQRYEDYLDEQDSEKLPNAFDLGWKRNLIHLFGDKPLFWLLPICNTSGDGWHWEPSPTWMEAREEVRHEREAQWLEQEGREGQSGYRDHAHIPAEQAGHERIHLSASHNSDRTIRSPERYVNGNVPDDERPTSGMSMKTLRRKSSFEGPEDSDDQYDISSDEEGVGSKGDTRGWYGQPSSRGRTRNAEGQDEEWREWD